MPDYFPRSKDLPSQSPLFWVTHKDRYLRQLLIRDIEEETGRDLVVYFTDCDNTDAQIDPADDACLAELLASWSNQSVDLLLETNGGMTDATEKICTLLRQSAPDLRVIVPRRAKSNGTVLALCGTHILMGTTSELGPIDPHINGVPVEFVVNAPAGSLGVIDVQIAEAFRKQTRKLASDLLTAGMMKACTPDQIQDTVNRLASRDHYHSHGSVIDPKEAKQLGLSVVEYAANDPLWQKIWLLRTMYGYDCGVNGYAKLFESQRISTAVRTKQVAP